MPSAGGQPVQITKGQFEAWRPSWSPDGTRIAFDANEGSNPGSRQLSVAAINGDPSHATIAMVTSGRGTNIDPQWSPDGRKLVYQHTDPQNSADLFVIDVSAPGSKPVRLTDSFPPTIDRTALVEPQLIHYPGPDGKSVPAYLFVPKNINRAQKHPAVVWIHGDGVNQNYDGWHVQRNYAVYYSFHQYLLQQGYIVIAPDYRGSIGYGSAWREGVYMDVGGKDFRDAALGANYLKTLPYVDADRIGVWGLSYGGFFTLLAVTEMPTMYRAAVDVAGVADYAMYYEDPYHGGWTTSRIGTPAEHPDVYAQASPISHVDRLVRPLLILHGTADVNVPYLHSVRLIDELLKKKKGDLVEFMTYPGEFHYFTREHVPQRCVDTCGQVLRQVPQAGDTPAIMTAIQDDTPVVVSRRQLSTTLGDEVVILGLDDEVYYGLDGAGARLWNLLQTPRSLIEVVEILLQEFDVTRDRLTADLRALFESLNERGLLTTADSPRA